jgi:phosphoglycolate phosphatase-like HAD superfamily hydrolase
VSPLSPSSVRPMPLEPLVPVFDLDGTLLDSDAALIAPFLSLGLTREELSFGSLLAEECERLGIDVDAYLDRYDTNAAPAFPGTDELVQSLDRWALCSNKLGHYGRAELERLGWHPELALFADAFDGPKRLGPVLERLGLTGGDIIFVGDTAHDRACAAEVGAPFALAGWNERTVAETGDLVLRHPAELLGLIHRDGFEGVRLAI